MKPEPIYITWINAKGGFEYFLFTAKKVYNTNIEDSGSVRNNILPRWPYSYGKTADTIIRQSYRITRKSIVVVSQNISLSQLEALYYIKSSVLVQIVYSRTDRRTVLIDTDSFKRYSEDEKLFSVQFTLSYTDEIPAQTI